MIKTSLVLLFSGIFLLGCEAINLWKDTNEFKENALPGITISTISEKKIATIIEKGVEIDQYEADGTTQVNVKLQLLNQPVDTGKRNLKLTVDNGHFVVNGELKKTTDVTLSKDRQETNILYTVPQEGTSARLDVSSAEGLVLNYKDFRFLPACPDYMEIEVAKTIVSDTDIVAVKTIMFRNQGRGLVSANLKPVYLLKDINNNVLADANFTGVSNSSGNGVLNAALVLEKRAKGKYIIEVSMEKAGCANQLIEGRKKVIEVK